MSAGTKEHKFEPTVVKEAQPTLDDLCAATLKTRGKTWAT
jgi:hypothetical protein